MRGWVRIQVAQPLPVLHRPCRNAPREIGRKHTLIFVAEHYPDWHVALEGEGAQFLMSDSASPTIVRDRADPSALYVLMPMRV